MEGVLKPGDPDYEKAVKDMKLAIGSYVGSNTITFKEMPLKQGKMEYAVVELTEAVSKIVFHFVSVPRQTMLKLSNLFFKEVRGKLVTDADEGAEIEVGENPIYRANWDAMIYHINKYKAPQIMNAIVRLIAKEFGA